MAELRDEVAQLGEQLGRTLKILVGKPGLDGHSNGAEQIAVRARDAGMDVVYEGIRLTPAQIARSAVDEGVHVIGLSILSGSHLALIPDVVAALREAGGGDIPVVAGGIIPDADVRGAESGGRRRRVHPEGLRDHPDPALDRADRRRTPPGTLGGVTRIVAAIALTLGLAAPAAADTVARRTPAVGPALAGDLVAWGEEAHNGAVRVMVGAPGREPMLAYRIRPATARRTEPRLPAHRRGFAASATAFAALVYTATVTASGLTPSRQRSRRRRSAGRSADLSPRSSGCDPAARRRALPRRADSSPTPPWMSTATGSPSPRRLTDARTRSARPLGTPYDDAERQHRSRRCRRAISHVELAGRFVAWIHAAPSTPRRARPRHAAPRGCA